jgi:hypothetical protein
MAVDPTADQDAIEARLKDHLVGGRVFVDVVPEESELERDESDPTRPILPYILLTFGALFPRAGDTSITGLEDQPQVMPIIVECWADTGRAARKTANAAGKWLLGFEPTPNSSQIALQAGSRFQQRDGAGRPTRAMSAVNAECDVNQSVDTL